MIVMFSTVTLAFMSWNAAVEPMGGVTTGGELKLGSEPMVIRSVNVDSNDKIWTAGMSITSATAVSNSSITVSGSNGFIFTGANSSLSMSTAVNVSLNLYALYLNGASSNTISNSRFNNQRSTAAYFTAGSNYCARSDALAEIADLL